MQLSNIPGKLVLPFANAGGKSTIPVASQIGITAGAASLTDGFPPLTRTPIAAGGVPPSGLDMNGILYEMSAIIRWANAGGGYPYDGTFATDTNVGGYPKGARIMRSDGTGYWYNTTDNNVTDPESSGAAAAGWVPDFTTGVAAVTMTGANVTLTPDQYGKPIIVISGALTTNLNLIFPNITGQWLIVNNATGAFTVTCKTASGTGIAAHGGQTIQIYSDGTSIKTINNDVPISVMNYGATGIGIVDDYPAFMAAINALPANGGTINVPPLTFKLNTEPTWGSKSIFWNISPGAVFTGTGTGSGKFPYQKKTNAGQMAVGPWIQSQSSQHSTDSNGGIAALQVEMLQPNDYGPGQSVALFLGARGSCPDTAANVWALNPLIHVEPTAGGVYQCIEVDVDNFSSSALVKGISINGVGDNDPFVALEIIRTGPTPGANGRNWVRGIDIRDSRTGIWINPGSTLVSGIQINAPAQSAGGICLKQLANNTDAIFVQRKTDTSPLGFFFKAVNAANNTVLMRIGIDGSILSASNVTCNAIDALSSVTGLNFKITGGAVSVPAGQICLGYSTTTIAAAGSAGALPAQVAGYWAIFIGSSVVKIPYYN